LLDHRQHGPDLRAVRRRVLITVVQHVVGDQGDNPINRRPIKPGGDPLSQPLLARAQGRTHDAFPAPGRRRLDPLCSATRQQLLPHPIGLTLLLTDLTGQPCGQQLRVRNSAHTEPEMLADLGAVRLDRPARPLVEPQLRSRDLHLAAHEIHRFVGQLRPVAREATEPGIELQQQGEPSRAGPRFVADLLTFLVEKRPILDQFAQIQR